MSKKHELNGSAGKLLFSSRLIIFSNKKKLVFNGPINLIIVKCKCYFLDMSIRISTQ